MPAKLKPVDDELPKPAVRISCDLALFVERSSTWLPEPPPDPNLLRRLRKVRWDLAIAIVLIAFAWIVLVATSRVPPITAFPSMIAISIWIFRRVRTNRASPYLEDLLDLPAVVPQYPVQVVYRVNESAYGFDEGFVSIIDGWLHFQGRRSTFSIFRSDASHRRHDKATFQPTERRVHAVTWMRLEGIAYWVELQPLNQIKGVGKGLAGELQTAILMWNASNQKRTGTPVWPPRKPMPGLLHKIERSYIFWTTLRWISVAVSVTSIGGFLLIANSLKLPMTLTFFAGLICFAVVEFNLERKAWALRDICYGCEGGLDEDHFSRFKGPWWKRINRPSVF